MPNIFTSIGVAGIGVGVGVGADVGVGTGVASGDEPPHAAKNKGIANIAKTEARIFIALFPLKIRQG
jgi:hypothetical protein